MGSTDTIQERQKQRFFEPLATHNIDDRNRYLYVAGQIGEASAKKENISLEEHEVVAKPHSAEFPSQPADTPAQATIQEEIDQKAFEEEVRMKVDEIFDNDMGASLEQAFRELGIK